MKPINNICECDAGSGDMELKYWESTKSGEGAKKYCVFKPCSEIHNDKKWRYHFADKDADGCYESCGDFMDQDPREGE